MNERKPVWSRRLVMAAAVCVLGLLIAQTVAQVRAVDRGEPAAVAAAVERLEEFERDPIPDEANAARWLLGGAGAVVWSSEDQRAVGSASGRPMSEWAPETEAGVRAALERHRSALDIMARAVALDQSNFDIHYSDGMDLELPDLLGLLRAVRLLACDARVAFADGDTESGLVALATIRRTSTALSEESTLITYLVSVAMERILLLPVAEAVASNESWVESPTFLDDLESLVPSSSHEDDLRRILEAWDAVMWMAVQKKVRHRDLGPMGDLNIPDDLTRADLDRARDRIEGWIGSPYALDAERHDRLQEAVDAAEPENGIETDVRGFSSAIGRTQAVAAQRQLVRAAIALRRQAPADGGYPAERPDLPELHQRDPFTDRLLRYERREDGSVQIEIEGIQSLLEPITTPNMASLIRPIDLPAP